MTHSHRLERPRKTLRESLETFRNATDGNSDTVASILWRLLTPDEKSALQDLARAQEGDGLGPVARKLTEYADGLTDDFVQARSLLASAGREVYKTKGKTEKALKFKFSQHIWAKICTKQATGRKRGRKNIIKDPGVKSKVRAFLMANSQISSKYKKIGKDLVQCRALSRSKSKLWKFNKDMQQLMSLSTWLRHLKSSQSLRKRLTCAPFATSMTSWLFQESKNQ